MNKKFIVFLDFIKSKLFEIINSELAQNIQQEFLLSTLLLVICKIIIGPFYFVTNLLLLGLFLFINVYFTVSIKVKTCIVTCLRYTLPDSYKEIRDETVNGFLELWKGEPEMTAEFEALKKNKWYQVVTLYIVMLMYYTLGTEENIIQAKKLAKLFKPTRKLQTIREATCKDNPLHPQKKATTEMY